MSYSLNEIDALCKRAARGAGFGWGLAEEAGKAARWLCAQGQPGTEDLLSLLRVQDARDAPGFAPKTLAGAWQGDGGALCALHAGVALSDCADRLRNDEPVEMLDVLAPRFLIPFAASAARRIGAVVALEWDRLRMESDGIALWCSGDPDALSAQKTRRVTCQVVSAPSGQLCATCSRHSPAAGVYQALSELAHRTYAPATEASRLSGAGAGLSDND